MMANVPDQAAAEYVGTTAVSFWSTLVAGARDAASFAEDNLILILGLFFLVLVVWRLLAPRH